MQHLTAHELHDRLSKREISATDLAKAVFGQIDKVEGQVKAYLLLLREQALRQAAKTDEKISRKEKLGTLEGIPIGIKDNMCMTGVRTTCASKILENYLPPYTATVVEKLSDAGALFTGKLNLDEFAMGSSTENSAYQKTANPWNLKTVPGGSSGGSAAAVAADECILALGSDTGGSIRQPASFCGVVGLKPTYGRVSRYGLVAFASSLDQIGPLTKDVKDAALTLNVIAGVDHRDSTSARLSVPDYTAGLNGELGIKRVGVVKELLGKGMDPDVVKAIKDALKVFERLGAEIVEVSMPTSEFALATYYLVATAEPAPIWNATTE